MVKTKNQRKSTLLFVIFFIININLIILINYFPIKGDVSCSLNSQQQNPIPVIQVDDAPIFVMGYSFDFDLANNLYLVYNEQQANHNKLVFKSANNDYIWNLTGETIYDENLTLGLLGDPSLEVTSNKIWVVNQYSQGADIGVMLFYKNKSDYSWTKQILISNDSYLIKEPIIKQIPTEDDILLLNWRDFSEGSYNVYSIQYNITTMKTSNLVRISDNSGLNCSDVDFIFDDEGNIHYTWAQGPENFEKIVYRQVFANGTMDVIEYLTDGANRCKEPTIIVDGNNKVNIFFGNYTEINPELEYGTKNINSVLKYETGNWSHSLDVAPYIPIERPPSGESDAERPTVTLDVEKNLWLAYEIREQYLNHMGIDIRHRSALGWQDGQRVSSLSAGAILPLIKTDNAGNMHILWLDPRFGSYEVYYRIRFVGGQWSDETSLSSYPIGSGGPIRIVLYTLAAVAVILLPVVFLSIIRRKREKNLIKRKMTDLYE